MIQNKRVLYTLTLVITTVIIIFCVLVFVKYNRNRLLERFENDKKCSLAEYFTRNGKYTNNPDDDNYWLKQQSSSEKEIYDTLLKEADEAEANGNIADASVLRDKISQLQEMRLNLRKKTLDGLEKSYKNRGELEPAPLESSCTMKANPIKVFEISGNTCSIATVVGSDSKIYSFPDILKPTNINDIFTVDKIDSCYLTIPEDVSIDTALVMVLNVLDAIGEKLNSDILNDINKILEETRVITRKTDILRNITIPKTKQELQSSIDGYHTTRESLLEMKRRINRLKDNNKLMEDENNRYNKDIDDIVEIYEHCYGQGRKFILKPGMTSFTGINEKLIEVSSVYFNDKKGIYLVLYDKNYNPYTIRKSVDCLVDVKIGGGNGVNLNDNVIAIEVIKSNKKPSNSIIASSANQKKVLDVAGVSADNFATVYGWEAHGGNNQKWTYNTNNKNITATHSGKCLDALYGGTNNYTKVIQYQCHNGNNMKWDFLDNGLIKNVNADRCLQADPNNIANNGFDVYLYDCDPNSQYQQWNVIDDLSYLKPKSVPQTSTAHVASSQQALVVLPQTQFVPRPPKKKNVWSYIFGGRR